VTPIEERLRNVVTRVIAVEREEFRPEASLIGDFNADSFDLVEIAMGIEDEFDIEIPPDDMSKFTTIGEIMDYIKAHLKS
jgi:acyl carrier protein